MPEFETHLTLMRKCTTRAAAESAVAMFTRALGMAANPRVVALGPGRWPWGVVVEEAAIEATLARHRAEEEAQAKPRSPIGTVLCNAPLESGPCIAPEGHIGSGVCFSAADAAAEAEEEA